MRPLPHRLYPLRPASLRAQFALVIALLSFGPNVVLTVALAAMTGTELSRSVLVWIALVALVSGLMALFISRALLTPLSKLTVELATRGVGEPLPDDPSEVRALRGAFRGLLGRLRTERERRGAFMATLVHDLKTPLIATSHLIALLREGQLPPEAQGQAYAQVLEENARLLHLVGQMADAHKFERDDLSLTLAPAELRPLLDSLAARYQERARSRGLRLTVSGAGTGLADPKELERGLGNLLDNALRYAKGEVRLEAAPGTLRVLDDGPGLAAPLASLAQPFNSQPVEIAGHRYTAGTAGLGLYIARRVAEAHGGRLCYARADHWSAFTVHLAGAREGAARPEVNA